MLEPIPSDFHNDDGNAFEHCMVCECKLAESPQGYFIEKAIKKYPEFDTKQELFAYAICFDCADSMHSSLSKESRQNVKNYLTERLQNNSIPKDLQQCSLSGNAIADMKEYQIQAYCLGDQIHRGHGPLLIGETAIEEISELLSDKSWEELDRFTDTFFGLPPEFRKAVKDRSYIPL